MASQKVQEEKKEDTKEFKNGFLIAPVSGTQDRTAEHFNEVFQDIVKPAGAFAGFHIEREADSIHTGIIQMSILKKITSYDLVICDLSTQNPNVLFELGIRQAFNLPVVIIKETGTPKIFDVDILRYVEYDPELKYRNVIEIQKKLAETINETMKNAKTGSDGNSLIQLLGMSDPAIIKPLNRNQESDIRLNLVAQQMEMLSNKLDKFINQNERLTNTNSYNSSKIIDSYPHSRSLSFQIDKCLSLPTREMQFSALKDLSMEIQLYPKTISGSNNYQTSRKRLYNLITQLEYELSNTNKRSENFTQEEMATFLMNENQASKN